MCGDGASRLAVAVERAKAPGVTDPANGARSGVARDVSRQPVMISGRAARSKRIPYTKRGETVYDPVQDLQNHGIRNMLLINGLR